LDNKEIGANIKQYRKSKKMTQQELGNKIDKTESTIRKYENGSIEVPLSVLAQIAESIDTNIDTLLGSMGSSKNFQSKYHYFMTQKIELAGYETKKFDEENTLIKFPDGWFKIKNQDLIALDKVTNAYLRFQLEELKNGNKEDFENK
jgi:transcriptional regulator with XRE-family HTH domain